MQLSVPFNTSRGTFSLKDDHMTIQLEGQEPSRVAIKVAGTRMTIKGYDSEDNSPGAFSKFEF